MSNTAGMPEPHAPAVIGPDPVHPAAALFPLGRPFGLLPVSEEVCPDELLPFGLRKSVASKPVPAGDLSAYGYDHERQMGIILAVGDAGRLALAATGTNRTTHADGAGGPRTDQITDTD